MNGRATTDDPRRERYDWESGPRWSPRGLRIHEARVAQLLLKETTFPPGVRVPHHEHPLPKVTITLAGGCTEQREGREHRYDSGTLQVNPTGSSHAYRTGTEGMRIFSVTFGPSWSERLPAVPLDPRVANREPRLVSLAWRLHQEFLRPDDLSPLVMEELLTGLVDRCAPADGGTGSRPAWLDRLLSLVHDTFAGSMGLSDYAEEIGIDRSHLARTFRDRFGCTLGEYVRGLRVARARLLLMETDRPLADVAHATGFSDQSHMGRTFRRLLGPTPGQIRRAALEPSERKIR